MRKINQFAARIALFMATAVISGAVANTAEASIRLPDIQGEFLTIAFDSTTFTAKGALAVDFTDNGYEFSPPLENVTSLTLQTDPDPAAEGTYDFGTFLLSATITGASSASGSLEIYSYADNLVGPPDVAALLLGSVSGYVITTPPGGGATQFDFIVKVNGGDLASLFGPMVVFTSTVPVSDWNGQAVAGTADVYAVPEPQSIVLWSLLSAVFALSLFVRSRRNVCSIAA